ncbi:hypothetical protein BCR39DRAFT_546319 [Naematelia encephala]|uniref:Uncharacterized protein n=1 Tax=Naematelia encephala TaxID=71784 RepID=A0A1Y2AQ43_9TREE|nr:hypothetical protein BCR39DRAFT_546319 [Naematelia encephala]
MAQEPVPYHIPKEEKERKTFAVKKREKLEKASQQDLIKDSYPRENKRDCKEKGFLERKRRKKDRHVKAISRSIVKGYV